MDNQFGYQNSNTPYEQNPDPVSNRANGYAIASLVLGIIAMVTGCCCCCCVFVIGGICGVAAVVLAILARHSNNGKMPGKAVAGLILGIIAIILCMIFFVLFAMDITSLPTTPEEMQAYLDRLEQFYRDMGFDVNFDVDFDEFYSQKMP